MKPYLQNHYLRKYPRNQELILFRFTGKYQLAQSASSSISSPTIHHHPNLSESSHLYATYDCLTIASTTIQRKIKSSNRTRKAHVYKNLERFLWVSIMIGSHIFFIFCETVGYRYVVDDISIETFMNDRMRCWLDEVCLICTNI